METKFCSKRAIREKTGLSDSTLKKYRLSGDWIEGIHWQRLNSRCVRYNAPLILDWIANRCSPQVHLKAIENYVRSLPSHQQNNGRGRS